MFTTSFRKTVLGAAALALIATTSFAQEVTLSFSPSLAAGWVHRQLTWWRANDGPELVVRLEDFTADPVAEMRRVLEHCELEADARSLVGEVSRVDGHHGRWRFLDPAQSSVLDEMLAPLAEDRGY